MMHDLEETRGGATVVFGGQAGSEGKGAIAAHLALNEDWDAAICTFMPNAGHTWVKDSSSEPVVVSQLPISLVSSRVKSLLIGPGAAIDIVKLLDEIDRFERRGYSIRSRLAIHPRALIITDDHRKWEEENLKRIASTGKGCGAALAQKVARYPGVLLARDMEDLRDYLRDTTTYTNDLLDGGGRVLVEGAQGYELDINHGVEYPFCTSRGTTPMQILADCGIGPNMVRRNIAVVRSYPIRVGNVVEDGKQVGHSGPYGAREVDFEDIAERVGDPDISKGEFTTVTHRKRRIFEIDLDGIGKMSRVCRPTEIALTFADYVDPSVKGMTRENCEVNAGLTHFSKLQKFVFKLQKAISRPLYRPPVRMIKTGPYEEQIIYIAGGDWRDIYQRSKSSG